jgi:hypothetical protein
MPARGTGPYYSLTIRHSSVTGRRFKDRIRSSAFKLFLARDIHVVRTLLDTIVLLKIISNDRKHTTVPTIEVSTWCPTPRARYLQCLDKSRHSRSKSDLLSSSSLL